MSAHFKLWTLEELAVLPQPEILIPDALRAGDLAVITGEPRFATALHRALGSRKAILFHLTGRDGPTDASPRFAKLREGDHPLAVLLHVRRDSPHFDYWAEAADCVLDAETPSYAVVEKLREHDDDWKSLRLVGRVAWIADRF